ncbi:MAG: NUDIX domain-containing protein [Nitrososphaerales archaeon]
MAEPEQRYPEPTVGALVVHESGEILLVRSYKWRNLLSVPGGHIEVGERAEDAVRREVKEEVGLEVEPLELLLIQQAIYPKNFTLHRHFIFLDYLCTSESKEVKADNREIQEYMWIDPEEALKEDLEEYTRNLINRYLSERK